uniref:Oxidoreductase domain protein n=1 Tax=Solibacter usitatus (strain Ellin6076) TaxID=234267 RepID=Q022E1_SOLUE
MLSWLVVGIGDITRKRVLPAILAERRSRLAGIVTRDSLKAATYGVPSWTDLDSALDACECEAVYIATPVFLHSQQTIAALRAGRHVICEKPMALDYPQAEEMNRTAQASVRKLAIAYYRRLYPKVERARHLIERGVIGRPLIAEATAHDWFNPVGTSRAWLADPAQAGHGPLRDVASHRIDLMNYLFGKPVRASGFLSTLVQPLPVEDSATVMIDYQGGVRAVVDARWNSRVARDEFRVRGTDGEIDLSPLNGPELRYPGGQESIPAPANLHYPFVEDFVTSVLRGIDPVSNGASALAAEWVMDEAAATSRLSNAEESTIARRS